MSLSWFLAPNAILNIAAALIALGLSLHSKLKNPMLKNEHAAAGRFFYMLMAAVFISALSSLYEIVSLGARTYNSLFLFSIQGRYFFSSLACILFFYYLCALSGLTVAAGKKILLYAAPVTVEIVMYVLLTLSCMDILPLFFRIF